MHTKFSSENLKRITKIGRLGNKLHGNILQKHLRMWARFIFLRIGSSGGLM
jgi:hypothetical protein